MGHKAYDAALVDQVIVLFFALVGMGILTFGFVSQGYPTPPVSESEPQVPMLMFFTLGIALLVAIAAFMSFLQSKRSAGIAKNALVGR